VKIVVDIKKKNNPNINNKNYNLLNTTQQPSKNQQYA